MDEMKSLITVKVADKRWVNTPLFEVRSCWALVLECVGVCVCRCPSMVLISDKTEERNKLKEERK